MLFTSVDSKGEPLKMTAEESRGPFKQWLENDSYAKIPVSLLNVTRT